MSCVKVLLLCYGSFRSYEINMITPKFYRLLTFWDFLRESVRAWDNHCTIEQSEKPHKLEMSWQARSSKFFLWTYHTKILAEVYRKAFFESLGLLVISLGKETVIHDITQFWSQQRIGVSHCFDDLLNIFRNLVEPLFLFLSWVQILESIARGWKKLVGKLSKRPYIRAVWMFTADSNFRSHPEVVLKAITVSLRCHKFSVLRSKSMIKAANFGDFVAYRVRVSLP